MSNLTNVVGLRTPVVSKLEVQKEYDRLYSEYNVKNTLYRDEMRQYQRVLKLLRAKLKRMPEDNGLPGVPTSLF